MRKLSKYLLFPLLIVILISTLGIAEGENINIFVNGRLLDVKSQPMIEMNRIRMFYDKIMKKAGEKANSFLNINNNLKIFSKEEIKKELEILNDILDNYVPKDIFKRDEIYIDKNKEENQTFLYLRNMKNEEEVSIKIESNFNEDGELIRYHLKSYYYDYKENTLNQEEALKIANEFFNKYIDKDVELFKIPDLYPSLYEKGKHETYGDKNGNYVVVVDLDHGIVEYFGKIE